MARHQKRTFGQLSLAGGDVLEGVRVLMTDSNGQVIWGTCTTIPSLKAGFAKGCMLLQTSTGKSWVNKSSSTYCYFSPAVSMFSGTPSANTTNRYVASTNMKVGSYTVANAATGDGFARNITVTHTAVGAADTLGTITVTGTDMNGEVISEAITPSAGATAAGTKAFKTVTSVVGADWVIAEANDTIVVGFGGLIGLPIVVSAASEVLMATHGTGVLNAPTIATSTAISGCTLDLSTAGDGSKVLRVFI